MRGMREIATYLMLLFFSAAILTGCGAYAVSPVTGFLYTDVKGPVSATNNPTHSKVGTAYASTILGLIGTGDASIETAAKNGGITKIHHVDYHSTSFLGLYAKYTVIVYGE